MIKHIFKFNKNQSDLAIDIMCLALSAGISSTKYTNKNNISFVYFKNTTPEFDELLKPYMKYQILDDKPKCIFLQVDETIASFLRTISENN